LLAHPRGSLIGTKYRSAVGQITPTEMCGKVDLKRPNDPFDALIQVASARAHSDFPAANNIARP
jgi:hypothetical protein